MKLSRRVEAFPLAISELLTDSHFMQGSEVIRLRVAHAHTSMGISLQLTRRSARGNRFKMKLAWTQFLQAAFNRTCRNAAVALHLDVAKSTVRRMQIMVSSAFMNKQAHFLAKLAQWRLHEQPAGVIKHIKWDETQLQCSMNADKSDCRVRSTWQVLVCRMRVMILWPSGHNLVYRIVMPPVTLLVTGAEHQYYALYHHPAYKCINGLVGYMRQQAKINIDVSETDGAASNLRLLAHLVQKAKTTVLGPPGSLHPLLPAHCRCMNRRELDTAEPSVCIEYLPSESI